jgi:hypothetical protein
MIVFFDRYCNSPLWTGFVVKANIPKDVELCKSGVSAT